uniref:DUF4347 domain-containing protein n=1 Tax=Planktothricoides sp. SpSt-374 TaxID=2282167 RepID=A0A7C3ZKJ7_9CYAN
MPTSKIRDFGQNSGSFNYRQNQNYQLLIIDPAVEDYQILLDGISPHTFVHILDKNRDGIEQITEILQKAPLSKGGWGDSSLHLITHGSPGTLYLGNSTLELSNIEQYRHQLQQWGIAHLYIYGCKVAAGDAGAEFLTKLHQITQAEIYANSHLTGNPVLGGTWKLQQILPCPPAPLPPCPSAPLLPCSPALFSPETLATYPGLLLEPEYEWAKNFEDFSGVGLPEYSIAVDNSGNIYTTGYFRDTVDFDPGAGTFNLTSAGSDDTFISKLNADGTFAWAKSFENSSWDHGKSIVIDNSGNIYTTGYFQGTADFDLGAGTFNLTSAGNANTFISKLNADGTFAWAKNFGNTYSDSSSTIAVDSSGNVYTTGFFSGTADFDPGSGTFNLTSSAEWADNFISKLNADGTFAWAKSFSINSNNYEAVHSIAVDDSGNVYTTGDFQGTTDFDPGPGTFNLTPVGDNDAFISKLNADGTFAWAKNLGGSGGDYGYSIAVDNSDNVYTAGSFGGTVDFDPGPGAANLTSAGKDDIFISKLNADGTFAWSKSFGGSSWDFGSSVDIDSSGNIYTTGYFSGTADFDPGPGTFNLTSAGNANPFISKLNPDGTFAWAKNLEGSGNNPSENFGFSIDIDNSDNVYTTGYFQGTVDFDPGTGTANLTSTSGYAGYYDVFISKLTPGVAPTVTLNSTATATVNGLFTVTATFSEDVIGFDISDITIDNGTAGNFTIVDAKTYTFDITPTTDGQVTVDIAAAQATDNAGNDNIAATPLTRTAALNSSWTKSLGGSSGDFGKSIAVDNSGNVYTIGSFYGTADFDPGAGTTNLTASGQDDIFISKLNADGTFAWAQNLGNIWGDSGYSVAIDNSGNIYTTGSFWGKVDFDPGVGTFNLTATGQKDTFISKLNADGTFAWAKSLGGSGSDIGKSIAVDDSDNVYTTGTFQGTADFNPGTGTFNLTAAGSDDTFISKLNADGTFAWAKNLGGSGSDSGNSIAVDNSGNVYTTGTFQGTADFNPGVGTTNLTSAGGNDTFISKLNADGTFGWAKNLGSSGDDSGRDIAVDITGNVYTTGGFRGTVDFDPGVGTDNLTSAAGSDDIFISKLNADGTFGWAKSFSGSLGDYGNSIDVDITGNVYTTGQFQSKVDFDPGVGTFNLTSAGGFDHFISKLNADGTFAWAESFEGVSGNIGNSIAVDSGGTIYTTGQFKGTVDFDPGVGTDNLTAAGDWDVFISKLDPTGIL